MFEVFYKVICEIFSVSNTKDIIALIIVLTMFFMLVCIIFIYYFNKYYTKKYKDDFFYLFWGYVDVENKMSADKHLSLIIYHFLAAYQLNSYSFFNKRYKFFPEDVEDIYPKSLMPNATRSNLNAFEKKHLGWIKFNNISQYFLYIIAFIILVLFFLSEYIIK